MTAPPLAVYDCMIFLQGLVRERGPAVACLDLFENGQVRLCVSPAILEEIGAVLLRPALRRKFPSLTPERVETLLHRLRERADYRAEVPRRLSYERDPKDEPYLNVAIAAGAAYLVSWDADLLDLDREEDSVGRELRRLCPGLALLDPVSFLERLGQA